MMCNNEQLPQIPLCQSFAESLKDLNELDLNIELSEKSNEELDYFCVREHVCQGTSATHRPIKKR